MLNNVFIYLVAFAGMVIQLFFFFLILTVIGDYLKKQQEKNNHFLTPQS